jgi:hypothetical protein
VIGIIKRLIKSQIDQGETRVMCDTCYEVFLKINTAKYLRESRVLNKNLPDKWIVLALEHAFYNPTHEINYYQDGTPFDQPKYELNEQLSKTNAEEIERFKGLTEALPF